MIISMVKHELRLSVVNQKFWYGLACLQGVLGLTYYWLLKNFLRSQTNPDIMHFGVTEEVFHPYFATFCLFMLVFIPVISTQSICGERQRHTLLNFYCNPITATKIVLGKFLYLNLIIIAMLLLASITPLTTIISGTIDWGQYFSSVLGVYLMSSAATAIGLALSSFMDSASRCNLYIFFSLVFFIMLEWAAQYAGSYGIYLQAFGFFKPLKSFFTGLISVQFIGYYLLLIVAFLAIATWRISRRWYDA